jgi:hypothetical protein
MLESEEFKQSQESLLVVAVVIDDELGARLWHGHRGRRTRR